MEHVQALFPTISGKLHSDSMDPDAYDQLRCDWYNATTGNLTGYDCPECKNRGYIAVLQDGYEIHRECACMIIRRNLSNIAGSGLEEVLRTKTFDTYLCKAPWQKALKASVMQYADKNRKQWLYIGGQTGAGKTHLCTAVCGVLLHRGVQVRYEIWQTILRDMNQFQIQQERFRQLTEAQVLYIDDFLKPIGARQETDRREIRIAFEVLNERYAKNKTTILSSERTFQDLLTLDRALAGRIKERCSGYMLRIDADDSRNYRMEGAGCASGI